MPDRRLSDADREALCAQFAGTLRWYEERFAHEDHRNWGEGVMDGIIAVLVSDGPKFDPELGAAFALLKRDSFFRMRNFKCSRPATSVETEGHATFSLLKELIGEALTNPDQL